MISIDDVMSNKYFTAMKGYVQPSGKVTSFTLWNPIDSGIHLALRQAFVYAAPYTAVNMKWRVATPPPGTIHSNRNSMFMQNPASAMERSVAQIVINESGPYAPQNDGSNYVLFPIDRDPVWDFRPEVPPVMGPGTGLIWYPDTSAAIQWTMSLVWEEQPIPAL